MPKVLLSFTTKCHYCSGADRVTGDITGHVLIAVLASGSALPLSGPIHTTQCERQGISVVLGRVPEKAFS